MKKELAIKQIFDDFVNKTILNENELEVLIKYIKGDSIIKISTDTLQSTSSVSRIIASLKEKYEQYKKLEIAKLSLLQPQKEKK